MQATSHYLNEWWPSSATPSCSAWRRWVNTLRPRQNGRHFADDIFNCIFFNENVWITIKISLKFVPNGPINNIPALVQIMAWRRPGDKPISGPMMVRLPTHICVTLPQWVNLICPFSIPCHWHIHIILILNDKILNSMNANFWNDLYSTCTTIGQNLLMSILVQTSRFVKKIYHFFPMLYRLGWCVVYKKPID